MNDEKIRQAMNDNFLTEEWMRLLQNYEINERWKLKDENLNAEAVCRRLDMILEGLMAESLLILENIHIKDDYKKFMESILNEYKDEVQRKRTENE